MPIAYWCILIAVLAPYFLSVAARWGASRSAYVQDPRAYSELLTGWRKRAHLAQLSTFEAVPAPLAGVVVAELANAPRLHVDVLAMSFVAARGAARSALHHRSAHAAQSRLTTIRLPLTGQSFAIKHAPWPV